jgi:hypothetical protein
MIGQTASDSFRQSRTRPGYTGPSATILCIAIVFFLGSVLVFGLSVWELKSLIDHSYNTGDLLGKISTPVNGLFFALNLFQLAISLPAIIASIALLSLAEWARKATIVFATVPVGGSALAALIFLASNGPGRAGLAAGMGFLIYGAAFIVFLLPSIWAWVVLTGDRAKSQFSGK